ncbi:hypothetical protein ACOSP7_028605 [Xanthoceras sorbifolium]
MASLVLLLEVLVRLQNPNSAIRTKLLPTCISATATGMPSIQKPFTNQPNNIDLDPVQVVEDTRLCIDDQIWPQVYIPPM